MQGLCKGISKDRIKRETPEKNERSFCRLKRSLLCHSVFCPSSDRFRKSHGGEFSSPETWASSLPQVLKVDSKQPKTFKHPGIGPLKPTLLKIVHARSMMTGISKANGGTSKYNSEIEWAQTLPPKAPMNNIIGSWPSELLWLTAVPFSSSPASGPLGVDCTEVYLGVARGAEDSTSRTHQAMRSDWWDWEQSGTKHNRSISDF